MIRRGEIMDKYFLYGASTTGEKALEEYGEENIIGFIDSFKAGTEFCGKPVISIRDYVNRPYQEQILVCSHKVKEIAHALWTASISNFKLYKGVYMQEDVPVSKNIGHGEWINTLQKLADVEGNEILEVGSRVVTGSNFRGVFKKANYTGFDLYDGPNVDVVGDAHQLTKYFDKKFDLIFSHAVFEHFEMPWIVADEMIKLLNPGGYIFVETHYSYRSHERPWHFFQFSENALKVLFSSKRGIECIEAGCSNPMVGFFSDEASEYLRGRFISGLYCHSDFLGRKVEDVELKWEKSSNNTEFGMYPKQK